MIQLRRLAHCSALRDIYALCGWDSFPFPSPPRKIVLLSFVSSAYLILFRIAECFAAVNPDSTIGLLSDSARTEVNLIMQTIKVLVALGITIVLLVLALWVLKKVLRLRGSGGADGRVVEVLEIQHIDPKKTIALVRIMDRVLIVGCAENSMTGLGELTGSEIERLNLRMSTEPGVFKSLFDRLTGEGRIHDGDTSSKNSQ